MQPQTRSSMEFANENDDDDDDDDGDDDIYDSEHHLKWPVLKYIFSTTIYIYINNYFAKLRR